MVAIGPVVLDEKCFEILDGRRRACTISSHGAFDSGDLKKPANASVTTKCLLIAALSTNITQNTDNDFQEVYNMAPHVVMQLQNRNIRVAVSLLNLFFVIKCHKEKDATE